MCQTMSKTTRTVCKHTLMLALCMTMLMLPACGSAERAAETVEKEITFPDTNLEVVLRRAIPKYTGPIYASDLEELTSLSIAGRNVGDLSGLEYCVNLRRLEIHNSRVTDVSPLALLPNLSVLVLDLGQISDTSPLEDHSNLTLFLAVTFPDRNFEAAVRAALDKPRGPLYTSELAKLTSLSVAGRNVANLSGLAHCVDLERLEIHDSRVSDVSLLASLPNLSELVMEPNQIDDTSPLDSLANLTVFLAVVFPDPDLEATMREIIGKPEGPVYTFDLEDITSLSAAGTEIADISGLEYCVDLERLDIHDSPVDDVSPLASLPNLSELVLDLDQISDESPLAKLTGLTVFRVVTLPDPELEAAMREAVEKPEGPIYTSDLEVLTSFTALGRDIVDLTGMEHCTGLTRLYLSGNRIGDLVEDEDEGERRTDISSLASLTELTDLRLDNNQIRNVSPLATLTSLTELHLDGNEISDVSPLATLTNLTWLYLNDNRIGDVSPLAKLTDLTWLWLQGNQIGDVSPLQSLAGLTVLVLEPTRAGDASPLASLSDTTVLWAVGFPDMDLRAAIREAIGKAKGPIYTYELEALTSLSVPGREIADLTGLEYCVNLRRLELQGNEISDISPLATLTSLTRLYLYDNVISDVSPLAKLTGLTDLRLHNNEISDLEPLLDNNGFSAPDRMTLANNPLTSTSIHVYITRLQERGVTVSW